MPGSRDNYLCLTISKKNVIQQILVQFKKFLVSHNIQAYKIFRDHTLVVYLPGGFSHATSFRHSPQNKTKLLYMKIVITFCATDELLAYFKATTWLKMEMSVEALMNRIPLSHQCSSSCYTWTCGCFDFFHEYVISIFQMDQLLCKCLPLSYKCPIPTPLAQKRSIKAFVEAEWIERYASNKVKTSQIYQASQ